MYSCNAAHACTHPPRSTNRQTHTHTHTQARVDPLALFVLFFPFFIFLVFPSLLVASGKSPLKWYPVPASLGCLTWLVAWGRFCLRERKSNSVRSQRDSTQVDVVFVKAFSTLKRKLQCVHDKNDTKGRVQNTNKVQRLSAAREGFATLPPKRKETNIK